jgi:NADH-quinone oxidoreductase subunit N
VRSGSILALQQRNLKRLLAYSSIAHLGYILIAIIAATDLSTQAVTFYLVAYFIAVIGAFGTLSVFNTDRELEEINDLRGMFWTRPLVSIDFSVLFFSMVGIPLTAGFMGKFYVVLAAVDHGMWLLALVLIISSIIGLYYYLRVIKTMLSPVEQATTKTANGNISKMGFGVVTILGILVILFGVVPSQLIAVIRSIGPGF